MKRPVPRNPEAGYALLFVYMMAASIAILLYMELPRASFEAQRDKEQLLIDRGEQYVRGIQLYFRKFHTYPPTLDALDNTQNIRFIRRRYKDPMTGNDEWRLIHVGAGGVLTDSLVNKNKSLTPATTTQKQNFVGEIPLVAATGSPDPNQQNAGNLATRRRPSDGQGAPGMPGGPPFDPNNPQNPNPIPPDPNNPAASTVGLIGTAPQVPGQPAATPATPTQGVPAQQNPYALSSGAGQPGAQPQGAVNLINQLLTSPRPGGLNGTTPDPNAAAGTPVGGSSPFGSPPPVGSASPVGGQTPIGGSAAPNNTGTPIAGSTGQVIGGGIAGVATKAEGEGIKVYNDRSKYKEWEFIYDLSKELATGQTGQQVPQNQNNGFGTQAPGTGGLNNPATGNPGGIGAPASPGIGAGGGPGTAPPGSFTPPPPPPPPPQ